MSPALDGAKVEVIRSYLFSAAQQMRRTLVRTAFNPVIYEILDFGISLYDRNLELVAEAPTLASFLGANDTAIRKGVEYLGEKSLEPGDIVLLNYPYWSAAHTLDVTLFAPVFTPLFESGERPFFYTCIRAHWMDLGAKDPGYVLDSTDLHQEGLVFPGTRVYKRGKPDPEILELIRFNSRMPELVLGDLDAQVAATRTGERRLQQIAEKFGVAELDGAVAEIFAQGERLARRELAGFPRGSWTAEDYLDDDGISSDLIPMRVKVSIDESGLVCDFTGSAAATPGPVNLPFGRTLSMCRVAFKALTTPGSPTNAGNFRPLRVVAPPGSLFHAVYPSSTFTLWTGTVALELIFKALAQAMPDRLAASSGGDVPGFMMVGIHPETKRLFAVSNNDPIGWGATRDHDGSSATHHLNQSLVRNTPVEVLETKTGMFIERLELRCDSGGAGTFRGGLGLARHIRFVSAGEFLSVMKKSKTRPWGLAGGGEPEPNAMLLFPGTPGAKRVGTYRARVRAGDAARNLTAGGGGYGAPAGRDPARVLEDVRDGYVSREAAREIYKVVLAGHSVDEEATSALRRRESS
jgi:N-methylhydantoinase B